MTTERGPLYRDVTYGYVVTLRVMTRSHVARACDQIKKTYHHRNRLKNVIMHNPPQNRTLRYILVITIVVTLQSRSHVVITRYNVCLRELFLLYPATLLCSRVTFGYDILGSSGYSRLGCTRTGKDFVSLCPTHELNIAQLCESGLGAVGDDPRSCGE
jgi:hypothetical protein